jgi:hypothetical protein
MLKRLSLITLFLLSLSAFGRSPAVEPIRGISIKEYKEVDPAMDPGFNWRQSPYVEETTLVNTRFPAESNLIKKTKSQRKSWPTYVFLVSLIGLPFVLWYSIMKGLEEKEPSQNAVHDVATGVANNTIDFNEEKERRQKDSDNSDIPKAS